MADPDKTDEYGLDDLKQDYRRMKLTAQASLAYLINAMPNKAVTHRQRELEAKHGTPRIVAQKIVNMIGEISVDEARTAILRYRIDWGKDNPKIELPED